MIGRHAGGPSEDFGEIIKQFRLRLQLRLEATREVRGTTAITSYFVIRYGEFPDYLGGLTKLEWLSIFDTQVSEAGLIHLVELPRLRMLFMYGIAVCPVGLAWLKRMKKLRALDVTDGLLSEADEMDLMQALPGLKVHRSWLMASEAPGDPLCDR